MRFNRIASTNERVLARAIFKMTPAEVEAYIEANVTNLASAKQVLKHLAALLVILAKEVRKNGVPD